MQKTSGIPLSLPNWKEIRGKNTQGKICADLCGQSTELLGMQKGVPYHQYNHDPPCNFMRQMKSSIHS